MAKKEPKTFVFYVREPARGPNITDPDLIYERMKDLGQADQESFWIIGLNNKNREIFCELISLGISNKSLVEPLLVFKRLLSKGASAYICCHNHPSGDPKPSQDDIAITNQLRRGGDVLGIKLLDHIIIGDGDFCSLLRKGLI